MPRSAHALGCTHRIGNGSSHAQLLNARQIGPQALDLLGTAGTTVVCRLCDALDAARCDLCDAPDAAPCDLCAAADAAPSPPSAPQHLTPSAPWLALPSPTRPLAPEGKTPFDATSFPM